MVVKSHNSPTSTLFSSTNAAFVSKPLTPNATESGFLQLGVDYRPFNAINLATNQTVTLEGSPMIGTSFQKASNANAAPGKLAQYGYSTPLKTLYPARIE